MLHRVAKLQVEMREPYYGWVYDPAAPQQLKRSRPNESSALAGADTSPLKHNFS
jgi:hypothetical protein